MKTVFRILFFSSFVLGFSACEPPEVKKQEEIKEPVAGSRIELPVERTITDFQGRSVDVTITEKTSEEVKFNRKSDGKEYILPIASLSEEDQIFLGDVYSARKLSDADAKTKEEKEDDGLSDFDRRRLKAIEEDLDKISKEIADLGREIDASGSGDLTPKVRGLNRQIENLEKERGELDLEKAEIERRRKR